MGSNSSFIIFLLWIARHLSLIISSASAWVNDYYHNNSLENIKAFRDNFDIPVNDDEIESLPFFEKK